MADRGHFEKMADQKVCGRDILWTISWITFKFDVVVLWVSLMIWLTFGKNLLKNKMAAGGHFEKTPTVRQTPTDCIQLNWIAFKFGRVVL